MGKDVFYWNKSKEEDEEEVKKEIKSLKNRIDNLESITMPLQTIGFADAQVYCIECNYIEHYNYYKPFTAPSKCSKCGGRMTDKQTENFIKSLEVLLSKKKTKKLSLHQPYK